MSRNSLKLLAALAMVLDHFTAIFIPLHSAWYVPFRLIGRLTAPIMCFFLAEGFRYTASRKKYLLRMAVFALISQPAFSLALRRTVWSWDMSMIFTMLLGLLMLTAWEEIENPLLRAAAVLGCIALSHWSDWALLGPVWVLACYVLRDRPRLRLAAMGAATLFFTAYGIWRRGYFWPYDLLKLGTLLALPLLALYNGEKGRGGAAAKWGFYVLYPAHLYLFAAIRWLR